MSSDQDGNFSLPKISTSDPETARIAMIQITRNDKWSVYCKAYIIGNSKLDNGWSGLYVRTSHWIDSKKYLNAIG